MTDNARPDDKPVESAETLAESTDDRSTSDQPTFTAPSSPELPSVGSTWGNLRILDELGAGAYGRVYRAWDNALERELALKIIRLSRSDPANVSAVLREGQMLARVRHRNVVTVYGAARIGDDVGLWMELVKGRPLSRMIREDGPMGAEEASVVGVSVCDALTAVHGAGLIHRDVKAQNVMRESGGRIVLMDFGAGRELAFGQPGWGDMAGTPIYMAPEVLSEGTWSPAADIYSLGVLLFFLVTGGFPVEGRSFTDVALAYALGHRRLLVDSRSGLPESFVRVVERALAPRDRRYATAGAMMHDLADSIPGSGGRRDIRAADGQTIDRTQPPIEAMAHGEAPAQQAAGLARLRWVRWVLAGAGVVLIIWLLGFLTTVAFNNALARDEFSNEGPSSWLYWGARAVFGVALSTVAFFLAYVLLRLIWWSCARVIPPLGRTVDRLRTRLVAAIRTAGMWNRATASQWLLGAQIVSISAVCWSFRHLIFAYGSFLDSAPAALLAELRPSETHVYYRAVLSWLLVLMTVAWHRLLKPAAGESPTDRPAVAAGLGMIALVLVLLAVPFRLIYHSEFPRADQNGERCYVTGQQSGRVLLFCPDRPPPRVRVVGPDKVQPGRRERIFAPPGTFPL